MSSISLKKNWEQLKPQVNHLYTQALRLTKSKKITKTKLGGKPCVADLSFQWPCVDNEPLAFIAQLDLAELAAELEIYWLPTTGILLFFYDVETMPWGCEPDDNELWKVIYIPDAKTDIDFPKNLPSECQFDPVFLEAVKIEQLPSLERDEVKASKLTDYQEDAYHELCDREIGEQPAHQVSGFPECLQGDEMELECQLLSSGLVLNDKSARSDELKQAADDWRLLLQLDTDEEADMMWGDCGTLYFWVKEQDAKACNFDDVRLILQCY